MLCARCLVHSSLHCKPQKPCRPRSVVTLHAYCSPCLLLYTVLHVVTCYCCLAAQGNVCMQTCSPQVQILYRTHLTIVSVKPCISITPLLWQSYAQSSSCICCVVHCVSCPVCNHPPSVWYCSLDPLRVTAVTSGLID